MLDNNSTVRKKICHECEVEFSCLTNNCWCSKLPTIMPLSDKHNCYCPECLDKVITDKMNGPQGKELKEHEDYYYNEEGYFVFTSQYHLKRGYCCKNGCKHCPYGFTKK